jgi:hypothetical protein
MAARTRTGEAFAPGSLPARGAVDGGVAHADITVRSMSQRPTSRVIRIVHASATLKIWQRRGACLSVGRGAGLATRYLVLSHSSGADRIVVLDNGRALEQGTHAELLRNDGLYSHLIASQLYAPRRTPAPVA